MSVSNPYTSRTVAAHQLVRGAPGAPVLERFWATPYLPVVAMAIVGVAAGIATGVMMPRGPADSSEALILLVGSILAGLLAGFAMRCRWASLLAPAISLIVFEIVRRDETGPSVDRIHLDSIFGILRFIVGRGARNSSIGKVAWCSERCSLRRQLWSSDWRSCLSVRRASRRRRTNSGASTQSRPCL